MKKLLLLLPFLATGCGCKDISCPSGQLKAFKGYVPGNTLQYTDGVTNLDFPITLSEAVTPASVPAEKASESFVRVCKPTQNCYEKIDWRAVNGSLPDSIRLDIYMQLVTPAHTQATVIFPQGRVFVNEEPYEFVFSPNLESPQAQRTVTDTILGTRQYKTLLQFQTAPANSISHFFLVQDMGIAGFTIRNSGKTFWRTDL